MGKYGFDELQNIVSQFADAFACASRPLAAYLAYSKDDPGTTLMEPVKIGGKPRKWSIKMHTLMITVCICLFVSTKESRAAGPASPPLLVSNAWSAYAGSNNFSEVGKSGDNRVGMILLKGSNSFIIFLASPSLAKVESDTIAFQISFEDGDKFNFQGTHSGKILFEAMSANAVSSWTLDLSRLSSITVSFPNNEVAPLSFDLAGAKVTTSALARLIRQSEQLDLPPPWGNQQLTCSVADSDTLRSNLYLTQPIGVQLVQFSEFVMAQTHIGWACLVRADFLGGSFQYIAYRLQIKPDGQVAMETQLMGQRDLSFGGN